jgi:dihydrofolate reductase
MRKIIILTFLSLDGVLQAPGGPEEDTSGGFKFGGWTVPYSDEFSGKLMGEQMSKPFDLLLGKITYEIFAAYWPKQSTDNPASEPLNKAHKYVASHTPYNATWKETTVLTGDVVNQIKKLKSGNGPDLQVYGSGNFIQTLLKNDLIDEMWLKIFPVTLGSGKKLFAEGTIPAAFKLTDSKITPLGVIFANYKRDGDVKTGSFV